MPMVPLKQIHYSPYRDPLAPQPEFSAHDLAVVQKYKNESANDAGQELANRMRPIVVRPMLNSDQDYELLWGEKDYCLANYAGIEEVMVQVSEMDDQEARHLVETDVGARPDDNLYSLALRISAIKDKLGCDNRQLANLLNMKREEVYRALAITNMNPLVQSWVGKGWIKGGAAWALCRLNDTDKCENGHDIQLKIAKEIVRFRNDPDKKKRLSVRDVEKKVRQALGDDFVPLPKDPNTRKLLDTLGEHLHLEAPEIEKHPKKDAYRLVLEFDDLDHLQTLVDKVIHEEGDGESAYEPVLSYDESSPGQPG